MDTSDDPQTPENQSNPQNEKLAAHFKRLRQRAERTLQALPEQQRPPLTHDIDVLLHELAVYQIELELQNEQLRQTQRDLRDALSLYELAPIGYLTLNEQGSIQSANEMAAAMLGVLLAALIGSRLEQFIFPNEQDMYYLYRRRVWQQPEHQRCELRLRRADGSSFAALLESSIQPGPGKDMPLHRLIISNISERKQAEDALRQSEEQYRRLVEYAGFPIAVYDYAGTVLLYNTLAAQTLGGVPDDFIGLKLVDILPPQAASAHLQRVRRVIGSGQPDAREEHVLTPQGKRCYWTSTFPLHDASGHAFAAQVIAHDITRQKQMEERLRFQAGLLNAIGQAVIATRPDNTIIYWNQAAELLYGWQAAEVLGHNIMDILLVADNTWQQHAEEIMQQVRSGQGWSGEFLVQHRDGAMFYALVSNAPFFDDEGNLSALIGVSSDISEQKQAQAELRQARDELATLLTISQDILSTLEIKPLLQRIFAHFARVLSYNSILVMMLQGDELEVLAYHGPPLPNITVGKRLAQTLWQPQTRQVIATRQPVYVPDIAAEPELVRFVTQCTGSPPLNRTKLMVPLIARDELIGILHLHHAEPDHYSERDREHVQAFASQIAIAIDNARLYAQAREVAAAEERNRLARDLHDAVSQKLFSASIIADALPDAWQQSPEIGQQGLGELQALMRGALAEMRTLLLELRPAALTERPLHQLLEALISSVASRSRMTISLDAMGDCDLSPDLQIALYRIVQEALNNSSKHARAQHVEVRLWCGPQGGELRIRDDGTGFVPDTVGPEHMGLRIMQERAAEVGATMDIQSASGAGTEIVVVWTYRDT